MHEVLVPWNRGGDLVTADVKDGATENGDEPGPEKSFFARGALIGLFAGAAIALVLLSVGGSVVSFFDDVVGPAETEEAEPDEPLTGEAALVATGEELATTTGCVACHSSNGLDGLGPTWSGLAGSERALADGGLVTADDVYLENSIRDPNAEIADGFTPDIMPATYNDSLSDEDIAALLAYIKSL